MDLQHSEVEGLCRFRYISYYINIQILIGIYSHYIILYYQLHMIFINLLHYAAIGVVCGICLLGTLFHLLLCGLAYGRDQLSKRWEIEETIEEMVAGVKTTNVVVCD